MQTNHLSHFLLSKELYPALKLAATTRGEARIVNTLLLRRAGRRERGSDRAGAQRQVDAAHVRRGEEVGVGQRGGDDGRQGGVLGRVGGGRREVGLLSRWSPRRTQHRSRVSNEIH